MTIENLRPAWSFGGEEVFFHGWTQVVSCAVGDGSHLYTEKAAIIEYKDGTLGRCPINELQFADRGASKIALKADSDEVDF